MNQTQPSQSHGHTNDAPRYDPHPGLVALGTRVDVEIVSDLGDSEWLTFDIVPDRAADFAAGYLGAGTPLAKAIMGYGAGTTVPYAQGDMLEVRILSVTRSTRAADETVAAERRAATRDAVGRAQTEEDVLLALTVNVKWGGYDPEPLEKERDDKQST